MSSAVSLGDAWRAASRRIDRLDARLLLEHVSGCTHAQLISDAGRGLDDDAARRYESLVTRRAAGEPFAYLVGRAGFYGLEFAVTPDVLIPRPDTELLVDLAVERLGQRGEENQEPPSSPRVVDLGTGSGIVAIVLARRCPQAEVSAVDHSSAALAVAQGNAVRHGAAVRLLCGDWYAPLGGEHFDLIVANPPYIAEGDAHLNQYGLPFEPRAALTDGVVGGDGLACIRRIVAGAPGHLCAGGWLLMEHGYDQAVEVRRLLNTAGWQAVTTWRDLGGNERVTGGRWIQCVRM